ncbi:MAG TPA: DUF1538 domain-containing protein [Methanomicrobia archaeon]|nr:DUF1538 domain-containing protein [Methanomicrobia archaeon]
MGLSDFSEELRSTLKSLLPAIALIFIFQILFIRMPLREFSQIVLGLLFAVVGFVLFLQGAKIGLLPMGERVGTSLIERHALSLILLFGFLLGIMLTIAEPDVRLLAYQIETVMVSDISRTEIISVSALGLGIFALIALLRIVYDTPIEYILVPGYLICLVLALIAPEEFLVNAFDMGAVTTGPLTVPFLIALGVGMASVLGGRTRLKAGFGILAAGSIGPIMAILLWGIIRGWL